MHLLMLPAHSSSSQCSSLLLSADQFPDFGCFLLAIPISSIDDAEDFPPHKLDRRRLLRWNWDDCHPCVSIITGSDGNLFDWLLLEL